ncbi:MULTISPECIES: PTS lactose/cellobiose transporter subunit IIA [Spiroplasma]|uniref:PTS system lactose-specific EIIA component n=1 Tax=Spiroplasma eriocheiris TaxID=315358 RepID=A0A0H3XLK0_9MOLU|nr:PTS lactose/cellobiose transporter subunit IIA [Spiroplasma eriocheiris]AHF57190.1 lactose-specific PTS system IIA component [Spiroplasma eriocheiris CCTCC M 207170]AKM53657.1 PTS system lactose-specific transporter subunit IIA [Spiroplasma eriocheiris]
MTKEKISELGLEIVAYSGDARSCYLRALKLAKQGNFEKAEQKIAEGEAAINAAHQRQTDLLQAEAQGNYSDVTMIMVHGQDHLMTTALLRDLINNLLDIYREKKEG